MTLAVAMERLRMGLLPAGWDRLASGAVAPLLSTVQGHLGRPGAVHP
jgi:hypothetical protein